MSMVCTLLSLLSRAQWLMKFKAAQYMVFFCIEFKTEDGTFIHAFKDSESWTKFVTKLSLLKF
eukprot:5050239-Karenia_brevis.AAC.1